MKHYATATWSGSGIEGDGQLTLQSHAVERSPYTFNSRFNEANGTNPEELIAAAHASDFAMKLSFVLTEAGYIPDQLIASCYINFEKGQIIGSHLVLKAKIPGIDDEMLDRCVAEANLTCPVSRILKIKISTEIMLDN